MERVGSGSIRRTGGCFCTVLLIMIWSILFSLPAAARETEGSPKVGVGQTEGKPEGGVGQTEGKPEGGIGQTEGKPEGGADQTAELSRTSQENAAETDAGGEDKDWYIAILGLFSRNGLQLGSEDVLDVALIVKIDRETSKVTTQSVPVDRGIESAAIGNKQSLGDICAQDGYEAALGAMSADRGIAFDDYLVFNWKAIADEINLLDGVEMKLSEEEFTYINAYVTETVAVTGVPSTMVKEAGMQYFDGVQLVAYGRMPQLDAVTREERQRYVLSMAWEKAMEADGLSMYKVLQCFLPQVDTSLDSEDIKLLYSMGRAA